MIHRLCHHGKSACSKRAAYKTWWSAASSRRSRSTGWRCCYGEEFPSEDTNQTVMFKSHEKDFALPARAFFRGLFHFYGLDVTHLKPNSIAQIAIFIHLCEGYPGIAPLHLVAGSVPP